MAKELSIYNTRDEVIATPTSLPNSDEGLVLQFRIPPQKGWLLAPHMNLHLQVSLKKGDSTALAAEDKTSLINYALMTMWSRVEVEFNQTRITPGNYAQPYISFLSALREYKRDERDTLLKRSLWNPDVNGTHNRFENPPGIGFLNRGLSERIAAVINDPAIDLYGPLMVDIFRQRQPFPDTVDINIKLSRGSNKFNIMSPSDNTANFQLAITKAELHVSRLQYDRFGDNTNVFDVVGVNRQMMFPYLGYETRQFTVPSKGSSFATDIYDGQLPQKVVICQIAPEAFDGSYQANPLMLQTFNIKAASLLINNNEVVPPTPYSMDHDSNVYSRVYGEALRILGFDIPHFEYKNGYFFVAFDLRRDRDSTVEQQADQKVEGHIRIQTEFTKEIEKPFILLCIFEFAKALCIKSSGHVFHM